MTQPDRTEVQQRVRLRQIARATVRSEALLQRIAPTLAEASQHARIAAMAQFERKVIAASA